MGAYFFYSILLTSFVYRVTCNGLWSRHCFLNPRNPNPFVGIIKRLRFYFIITYFVYPVICHALYSRYGFLSPRNSNPFLGSGAIDFDFAGRGMTS